MDSPAVGEYEIRPLKRLAIANEIDAVGVARPDPKRPHDVITRAIRARERERSSFDREIVVAAPIQARAQADGIAVDGVTDSRAEPPACVASERDQEQAYCH